VLQHEDTLRIEIKSALESLRIAGDIVDLGTALTVDQAVQSLVHCVPPSYLNIGTRVYLFGIAADDAPFLPSGIASLVLVEGTTRYIDASQPEQVCEQLLSLGLRAITPEEWFRKANYGKPANFFARVCTRLQEHGADGELQDVRVLLPTTGDSRSYSSRWGEPEQRSGTHIVRTRRSFGADAWLLANLHDGHVERSVLLGGIDNTMTRACDVAWLAQLAMDAVAGHPDTYRVEKGGNEWIITLNFPLPLSATRRLLYLSGRISTDTGDYYRFRFSDSVYVVAERFLQEQCWMQRSPD
jgi:hypothetical protein